MPKFIDRTGQRYGKLVALELADKRHGDFHIYYKCLCDCGNICITRSNSLQSGNTQSCGNCPNKFEHLSDGTTVVFLERKDGTIFRCFIDTVDYPLVQNFRWTVLPKNKKSQTNYAVTKYGPRMHRLLLPNVELVDHKDGNGLNNRRNNLRQASDTDSVRNRKKWNQSTALSPYKGVSLGHGKFRSYISIDGKKMSLGAFDSEVEAALAYDTAARKYFGEFATVNFPVHSGEQGALTQRLDDTAIGEEH